jgi:hypothetical protein
VFDVSFQFPMLHPLLIEPVPPQTARVDLVLTIGHDGKRWPVYDRAFHAAR